MAVEWTINVGFHSNFGRFRQCGHSKTPLRLADSVQPNLRPLKKSPQTQPDLLFCPAENLDAFPLDCAAIGLDFGGDLCQNYCNCLVQPRTYAQTGNRDLERDFLSHSLFSRLIAPTLRSWVGTGIKLQ